MKKTAVTAAPIMPVLADRWSPRSFDEAHTLEAHDLLSILEAARWAPSANNGQPWRFSVAHRGSELFNKLVAEGLTGFNQAWAPRASALIVVSVQNKTADGAPHRSSRYDAGLAVANLTIQAQELGLHSHQMGGIVHDSVREILELGEDLDPVIAIAVGKVAPAEKLEGPAYEREITPRARLTLDEIVLHGKP